MCPTDSRVLVLHFSLSLSLETISHQTSTSSSSRVGQPTNGRIRHQSMAQLQSPNRHNDKHKITTMMKALLWTLHPLTRLTVGRFIHQGTAAQISWNNAQHFVLSEKSSKVKNFLPQASLCLSWRSVYQVFSIKSVCENPENIPKYVFSCWLLSVTKERIQLF